MSNTQDETTMEKLEARLVELEHANTRMYEELVALRAERLIASEPKTISTQEAVLEEMKKTGRQSPPNKRRNRRGLLKKGLGFAVATVGVGALLAENSGIAHADGREAPTIFTSNNSTTPAVRAVSLTDATGSSAAGIIAHSDTFFGVDADSISSYGVNGVGNLGGVRGFSSDALGVGIEGVATGMFGHGVRGESDAQGSGVFGIANGSGPGVSASSVTGNAVEAQSTHGIGVEGVSTINVGVEGVSTNNVGVNGVSHSDIGVKGQSNSSTGVLGQSDSSTGVIGVSLGGGSGVFGGSTFQYGVHAVGGGTLSSSGPGAAGVFAEGGPNYGIYASSSSGTGLYTTSTSGPALVANGHVQVQGDAVGTATLLVGTTSVTVKTTAATTSSNFLLTPLANPKANLWVTRAAGSFTIHTSAAPKKDVPIVYLIIN